MAKCTGLSDDAAAFVTDYCALVEPCCLQEGVSAQCTLFTQQAAQQGPFDEAAGALCLAALRQRQAGASYCDGLAVISGGQAPPSFIPTMTAT